MAFSNPILPHPPPSFKSLQVTLPVVHVEWDLALVGHPFFDIDIDRYRPVCWRQADEEQQHKRQIQLRWRKGKVRGS